MLVLVLLVQLFWPAIIHEINPMLEQPIPGASAAGGDGGHDSEQDLRLFYARENLWAAVVAFPFQIATIIVILVAGGARLADMALTTRYFGRNLLLAILGWFLLAPSVLFLNLLVNLVYRVLFHLREEEHPMMRLMLSGPSTVELVLIAVTAIVAAPILEELLFRGVLQPWFAGRRDRGLFALVAALGMAAVQRWPKLHASWAAEGRVAALQEATAIGFVLAMIPGYFLARQIGRVLFVSGMREAYRTTLAESIGVSAPQIRSPEQGAMDQAGAIYATSLLFASAHSFAWPTPISLFVLALGLGLLVYRTQSIVGSITLHALFNSISVVLLLVAPQMMKGSDATSAVPARPPVVHSSTIPGS
jgi:membrane protease YdiL (CAAX protease family)